MNRVYIASAQRSAVGKYGGTLKDLPASKIGSNIITETISKIPIKGHDIDYTVIGNILTAGQGMGPGRQAAIYAGIPAEKCAYTINMLCGSGMKAVMTGAGDIQLGNADLVVSGGMENMSQSPYLFPGTARFGTRFGNVECIDHMIHDGLTDVFNQYHMGMTAENIVDLHGISRNEQDDFALKSQKRAQKAIESGRFKEEISPIEITTKKNTVTFDTDEGPRFDISIKDLSKLNPAFKKNGTVTAGNSSTLNDGAAMLVLASEKACEQHGITPLAEIISYSQSGIDPSVMGMAPVQAILLALTKAKRSINDIGLFELNEAFAAQSLGVLKELARSTDIKQEWLTERTNVNGGAIALGHPIGASGARIIVTLVHEMKKTDTEYGCASLCIGGGMGTAVIIKNC